MNINFYFFGENYEECNFLRMSYEIQVLLILSPLISFSWIVFLMLYVRTQGHEFPGSWRFSPMFSSISFTVVALTLSLITYFEWIFIYIPEFIHFASRYPIILASFVKKAILRLNFSDTSVENQLIISVKTYFWTLNSVLLLYMSILVPPLYWLVNCGFIVNFEI